MTLNKLYHLLHESNDNSLIIANIDSLQRRVRAAAKKVYKLHLHADMIAPLKYKEVLTTAWNQYKSVREQYLTFLINNKDTILIDADITAKIKKFKDRNPSVFDQ